MNNDEMLRVYESPEGHTFLRFGNKCFVRVEGHKHTFLAIPIDAGEWAANVVIDEYKLKRIKTINITREQEIHATMLACSVNRRTARSMVAAVRRLAQGMINIIHGCISIDGEIIPQRSSQESDTVLDAEIIDG